ncbi:MAG TPA: O-antigen ligase family protein [Pyrinomonadaceae bacterium]
MSMPLYYQQADGSIAYAPSFAGSRNTALLSMIFVAAHVPVALAMKQYPVISTLHAVIILIIGLRYALGGKGLLEVTYAAAYLTGSEVLWRMTGASVPWEYGKYAIGLIVILALMRRGHLRMPLLPTLYFVLLLPAIVPTVMEYFLTFDDVRQMVSANLSGPFALVACAWFFSYVKLNGRQLEAMFLAIIGPTVGIAVIALFSTVTAEHLRWGTQSNFVTSGGFGPNQVSGALGLGVLMALMLLLRSSRPLWFKGFIFATMAFLSIQSALTFSRGGLFGALGAAMIASFYLIRDRKTRGRLVPIAIIIVLTTILVLPFLDNFTSGKLSARFETIETTGRTEIAESDLRMWERNPFLGVGIGMSMFRETGWKAAHTEFTRLVAEHGVLGLFALLFLLFAGWRRLKTTPRTEDKAMIAGMLGWSMLFMADKAMRLAAPSFMCGLSFATLTSEEDEQPRYLYAVVQPKQESLEAQNQ